MSDTTDKTTSLSLLSPTETKALWSFLSQADKADVLAPEWTIFSNRPELAARTREGKEELTRATRSLMSIDDVSLTDHADTREHVLPPQLHHGQVYKTPGNNAHLTHLQDREISPPISPARDNSFPHYPHHRYASFTNDVRYDAHGAPSSSSSKTRITTLAPQSSSSTCALPYQNHSRKRLSQDQAPKIHTPHKRARKSSPSLASAPHPLTIAVPSSSSSSSLDVTAGQPASNVQQTTLVASPSSASEPPWSAVSVPPSHSLPDPSQAPYRPQHHHGPDRTSQSAKPPLLTTSQKKANHIQSEQKRRANIRRGYEALCEIVPALREAIKAEEEAERLALAELDIPTPVGDTPGGGGITSAADANAAAVARKKARGKAVAAAFGIEEGEKVDGRAGPRSEAVVLQKTIDNIGHLEIQRTTLINKIHTLRSMLPPSHPALVPCPISPSVITARRAPFIQPDPRTTSKADLENWNEGSAAPDFDEKQYEIPPWQRVWDGGTGLPIPGMGLPKPGMMKARARTANAVGSGGAGGSGSGWDADGGEGEEESDEDM